MRRNLQAELLAQADKPIDVTAGHTLGSDYQINELYADPDYEPSKWQAGLMVLDTLLRAKGRHHIPRDVWEFYRAYRNVATPPNDTEIVHGADERTATMTRRFIRRLMTDGSGFANDESIDHFAQAMDLNREGEDITMEIAPHNCALDPVIMSAVVETLQDSGDPQLNDLSKEFLQKQIMIVGQKVMLSRFRRVFASSVNTVMTVAPKYRVNLEPDEEAIVTAHSQVVADIVAEIRRSRDYLLMVCPEGGFTRDNDVQFQSAFGAAPQSAYHVPVFLNMPEHFLNPDSKRNIVNWPSQIGLHIGEPFQLESDGAKNKLQEYVMRTRDNLATVGAPVDQYSWGYSRINRRQPSDRDMRRLGAMADAREVIPKGTPVDQTTWAA